MSLACEALDLPVVSGNVSLYNEHFGRAIHPTPVVGVVGVLDDASLAVRAAFREAGDVVLLAGDGEAALDGSAYQKVVLGEHGGRIPEPDLDSERRLHEFLAQAAERGLLRSAHDVASGGIALCVAEAAIAGAVGAAVEADDLFGEGDGRVVIAAAQADVAALRELAGDLPLREIGTVGGSAIRVGAAELSLAEAAALHDAGIPNAVGA